MNFCLQGIKAKVHTDLGDHVSVNISYKVIGSFSQLQWPKMKMITIRAKYLHYLMCKNSEDSIQGI